MSNTQLSFALRTTSNVKTVHLIGSWDGYQGQLPLSRDGSRSGSWKGTFKFQPNVLQPGQRYWFYYMMDGHKVSHDPTKEAVVEPTTGRTLNVLDVPKSKSSSSRHQSSSSSKRSSTRGHSRELPRGRGVADGAIACPKPQRPGATKHIIDQGESQADMDQLAWGLAHASLQEEDSDSDDEECSPYVYDDAYPPAGCSDDDSDEPSMTSGSSRSSGSAKKLEAIRGGHLRDSRRISRHHGSSRRHGMVMG